MRREWEECFSNKCQQQRVCDCLKTCVNAFVALVPVRGCLHVKLKHACDCTLGSFGQFGAVACYWHARFRHSAFSVSQSDAAVLAHYYL